jgi:DNA modification methylase
MKNKILCGDSLEVLKDFEDNYFDSVVTDPPYGISFMSKSWDYDVPQVELWKEVYRVLKPGGHILSFAGSRTYHRMAVNIEDAGFEIRDMLGWIYGSGFPKSHNIGKAIDKKGGNSISWFGEWLKNWRIENNVSQKDISKLFPSRTGGLTGCVSNWELGFNIPTPEQFSIIVKEFDLPFKTIKEAEREVVGKKRSSLGGTVAAGERNQEFINAHKNKEVDITIPKTEQAKQWEGWGTALKPAHEPIVMARKPFNTSVAENVLTHGTGGINIDECRVGYKHEDDLKEGTRKRISGFSTKYVGGKLENPIYTTQSIKKEGRFPANIIHDGSEEVLEIFPETNPSKRHYRTSPKNKNVCYGVYNENNTIRGHNDEGTAARFFYCAKASKAERNMGLDDFETKKAGGMSGRNDGSMGSITYNKNHHPTVKPIKLMEYLVRLVTPKEGIVLEPFAGSGTTLIACKQQGFNYIGIEREQEYCDIAEARLKGVQIQGTLF